MSLSDEALREFIVIWEREFGERLTLEEARLEALRLIDRLVMLAADLGPFVSATDKAAGDLNNEIHPLLP